MAIGVLIGTAVLSLFEVGIAFAVRGPELAAELIALPGPNRPLALAAFLGLLTSAIGALLYSQWPWLRERIDPGILQAVGTIPPFPWLAVAVVGSAAEEILFRGALQPVIGLLPASAVFGFMHFLMQRRLVAYGVAALVMGVVLGLVYTWTESLGAAMAAHIMHNLGLWVWVRRSGRFPHAAQGT
jgi:membrane protease YdiL (CAAX protease family)